MSRRTLARRGRKAAARPHRAASGAIAPAKAAPILVVLDGDDLDFEASAPRPARGRACFPGTANACATSSSQGNRIVCRRPPSTRGRGGRWLPRRAQAPARPARLSSPITRIGTINWTAPARA
jgi:hypothetical protein